VAKKKTTKKKAPRKPVKKAAEAQIMHMLGGLPRAGSTLLCNILAQNPRFHASHTSGCMDIMFIVRNEWNNLIEHKAHPMPEAQKRVLAGIPAAYYADVKKPVIFDKCRGWPSVIEMAEHVLGRQIKILVPVRDIRNVLASFEKLWREQTKSGQVAGERENYVQMQTVAGRCEFWSRRDQAVGLAYSRIQDAIRRGLADRMHFVEFEELTANPKKTLDGIYKFLGEKKFAHDFDNVKQVTTEDDSVHGFGAGLHKIRSKVEPVTAAWPEILGKVAERYATENFWTGK
jgi:sulfotransferase